VLLVVGVSFVVAAPVEARRRPRPPLTTTRPPVTTTRPQETTTTSFIVSRPQPAPGRQLIDVRTAGATCDGSTEDTTAVQGLASAPSSVGKTLYFPPGFTCRVAQINLPTNVWAMGGGPTSVLKPITLPSASRYDSVFDVGNNVTISSLKIDGNGVVNMPDGWADAYNNAAVSGNNYRDGVGRGRGYRAGIRGEGVTGLTVDSVEFTNVAGAAVATNNSSDVTLTNDYAHDTFWELFVLFGSTSPVFAPVAGTNINIVNCTLLNINAPAAASAQGYNPNGMAISRATGGSVQGCTSTNTDRNFLKMEGVQGVDAAHPFEAFNNTILSQNPAVLYPAFSHQPTFGHHDRGCRWIRTHNNTVSGPGVWFGYQVNSSDTTANAARDIEIDHNSYTGGTGGYGGVLIDGSVGLTNISIHDNDFNATANAAVYVNGGGTGYSLVNNRHNGVTMTDRVVPGAFSESTWYN
jgi:hypothetical protein